MERKSGERKMNIGLKPKQVKFVHLLANPEGHKLSVAQVCEILKISKDTYYKWKTDAAVISAVNKEIAKFAAAFKTRAWNNLMECCDEHNVQAIKLYFELVGDKARDLDIHVTLTE